MVANQDVIQIDVDVNAQTCNAQSCANAGTDCKNATIDSEDEICSNYNEDDLSDDDDDDDDGPTVSTIV